MDIYGRLGRSIRERRRRLGMTLEELADSAQLHPVYIGQIERGVKKASLGTVIALAAALDVPVGEFFTGPDAAAGAETAEKKLLALLRSHREEEKHLLLTMLRALGKELRGLRARSA